MTTPEWLALAIAGWREVVEEVERVLPPEEWHHRRLRIAQEARRAREAREENELARELATATPDGAWRARRRVPSGASVSAPAPAVMCTERIPAGCLGRRSVDREEAPR